MYKAMVVAPPPPPPAGAAPTYTRHNKREINLGIRNPSRSCQCHVMSMQHIATNSIGFGKSTSHRIYPKQQTHKIG